ncbi:endodeoxyribonuclease [Sorochytrium milnesiophthora]
MTTPSDLAAAAIDQAVAAVLQDMRAGRMPVLVLGTRLTVPLYRGAKTGTRQFAVHLRLLSIARKLLATGTVATKRDVYYTDPALFVSQTVVDRVLANVAAALAVSRTALNIVASPKGLAVGPCIIRMSDGTRCDLLSDQSQGTLIPSSHIVQDIDLSAVGYILVVEKDAVFRHLCQRQWFRHPAPCLLVTGKGYPDLATRDLLALACRTCPGLPVLCLTDCDPHGVHIAMHYQRALSTSSFSWIGVTPDDLKQCALDDPSSLMPFTAHDRAKGHQLLQSDRQRCGLSLADFAPRALQHMLFANVKAEIQCLMSTASAASPYEAYLTRKLAGLHIVATEQRIL